MTKNNLHKSLGWLLQQTNNTNTSSLDYIVPLSPDSDNFGPHDEEEILREQEGMARLRSPPQSVARPRLMQNATAKALPTPSNSTLAATRSPQLPPHVPRSAQTPLLNRSIVQQTPVTSYTDSLIDIVDIEDIDDVDADLVDSSNENHTTSSFGAFGTPVRLWNEKAALRAEPEFSRGKKRTSDEFLADSILRGVVHDDSYESEEEGLGTQRPVIDPQTCTPSAKDEEDKVQLDDHRLMPLPTNSIAPKHSSSQSGSQARDSSRYESVPESPLRSSYQEAAKKRVKREQQFTSSGGVAPSGTQDRWLNKNVYEDPDISAGNQAPTSSKLLSRREELSPYVHHDIVDDEPSEPAEVKGEDLPDGSTQPANYKMDYPSAPSYLNGTPQLDSCMTPSQEEVLKVFRQATDEQFEYLTAHLKTQLKELRKAIMNYRCEGHSPPAELEAKSQVTRDKVSKLLPEITAQSKDLRAKHLERNRKKLELDAMLEDDWSDEDAYQEQTGAFVTNIFQLKLVITPLEMSLLRRIESASFSEDELQFLKSDEKPCRTPANRKVAASNRVLVSSTQHVRHITQDLAVPDSTRSLRYNSPPIAQTQIDTPKPKYQEAYDQWQQSNQAIPPVYPSRSPTKTSRNRFEVFEPEQGYTRTMGSPDPLSPQPDDFAEDFDDEEALLDVMKDHEQSFPLGIKDPAQWITREPLTEMSHNVQRPAPQLQKPKPPPASLLQHPWSKEVMTVLRTKFHLHSFRHNQLEAINETLAGKDTFVLMPTGGGKSLCYQLPSVIQSGRTHGVTVVISPLLSLMQDQVDHLQKLKIQAFLINSEVSADHKKLVFQSLRGPRPDDFIQLLYVTPEMISKSTAIISVFEHLHKRGKLARLVIDEAHCVSQWGHDFRPDYKNLGEVRRKFPGVPVMALTATATENVKVDVISNLSIDGCESFTQSFNRPNLTWNVLQKRKGAQTLQDIAELINNDHHDQSGIIYCLARKTCETVAKQLRDEHGVRCTHYHAGMPAEERSSVQKAWQKGTHNVIVATIAFGMGIDKPDVRFVIHHSLPKSLEGYYQETGRAGRDGQPSECYLFYGYGDTSQLMRQINDGEGSWEQKERQKQMLRNMIHFCENKTDCRRVQVLAYFNEHFKRRDCHDSCDNCRSDAHFETKDYSQHAKQIINLVRRIDSRDVTLLQCVDVYRGSKSKKVVDCNFDKFDEFNAGSSLDRGDIERLFYHLVAADALEEYNVTNRQGFASQYLKLGRKHRAFESGHSKLEFQVRLGSNKKARPKVSKSKTTGKTRTKPRGARQSNPIEIDDEEDGDHGPPPTCISSPVVARQEKKTQQRAPRPVLADSDDESEGPEDADGFTSVRKVGTTRLNRSHVAGPPITTDQRISGMDDVRRSILDSFVSEVRDKLRHIMVQKGLRQSLVSDTKLREIGIALPTTETELRRLADISNDAQWKLVSKLLQQSTRGMKQSCAEMGIDLSQPPEEYMDEDLDDDDFVVSDDEVDGGDETGDEVEVGSRFFDAHEVNDVARFNQQLSQTRTFIQPKANTKATRYPKNGTSKGSWKGGSRKSSCSTTTKARSSTGGVKKKRALTGSKGSSAGASKRTSGSSKQSGGRVFGMMPT